MSPVTDKQQDKDYSLLNLMYVFFVGMSLTVDVSIFDGDLQAVKTEQPLLFQKDVTIVPKLSQFDIINPGKNSDIVNPGKNYVEIINPGKKLNMTLLIKVKTLTLLIQVQHSV